VTALQVCVHCGSTENLIDVIELRKQHAKVRPCCSIPACALLGPVTRGAVSQVASKRSLSIVVLVCRIACTNSCSCLWFSELVKPPKATAAAAAAALPKPKKARRGHARADNDEEDDAEEEGDDEDDAALDAEVEAELALDNDEVKPAPSASSAAKRVSGRAHAEVSYSEDCDDAIMQDSQDSQDSQAYSHLQLPASSTSSSTSSTTSSSSSSSSSASASDASMWHCWSCSLGNASRRAKCLLCGAGRPAVPRKAD
jgi:hypothetical protein